MTDDADQAVLRAMTSKQVHIIIASEALTSSDGEAMRDFAAFLEQADELGRELVAIFQTADGKMAVVLRKRRALVAGVAAGVLPPIPGAGGYPD